MSVHTVASRSPEAKISIGELGEFGLIARIRARLGDGTSGATLLGPGDDAAVVAMPDGRVVASTDLLVDGRHFRRDWSSPYDVGRKVAAQNLADIAAMGAVPTALLVGLAAPPDLAAFWAERFADGLREECEVVGADVVGGDVVRSDVLTISATSLGDLQGRAPVRRSGARPGDLVAVAGRLGFSAAGFSVLRKGFRSPRALIDAHRRPEPPYQAGPQAADAGATSMIDVSDGLVGDLEHVALASGVRIALSRRLFAVPDALAEVAAAFAVDVFDWILTGGEDHALAATLPASDARSAPDGWQVIGEVTEPDDDGGPAVVVDGKAYRGKGFDHFG
jgi:thiamine-monophosphate kinase